jgi:uncharacterized protein (DUF433 family)
MTSIFRDFPRITVDPLVMAGKPCIRGMRVTVGMILGELSAGATPDDLLREFAYLEQDDVTEALRFAAWRMQERELIWQSAREDRRGHEPINRLGRRAAIGWLRRRPLVQSEELLRVG